MARFGPQVKDEKLSEAVGLFLRARPAPEGMKPQAWINQCLSEYFQSILVDGMLRAVREQGLMDASPYVDTDYVSYD